MAKNVKKDKKILTPNIAEATVENNSTATPSNNSHSEQNNQTIAEEGKKTTTETTELVTELAQTGTESQKLVIAYKLTAKTGVWEFPNLYFAEKARKDFGGEITEIYN